MYSLLYSVFKAMLRTTCYYYSSFTDKEKPRYKTATELGYQPGHLTLEHMLLNYHTPTLFPLTLQGGMLTLYKCKIYFIFKHICMRMYHIYMYMYVCVHVYTHIHGYSTD